MSRLLFQTLNVLKDILGLTKSQICCKEASSLHIL